MPMALFNVVVGYIALSYLFCKDNVSGMLNTLLKTYNIIIHIYKDNASGFV